MNSESDGWEYRIKTRQSTRHLSIGSAASEEINKMMGAEANVKNAEITMFIDKQEEKKVNNVGLQGEVNKLMNLSGIGSGTNESKMNNVSQTNLGDGGFKPNNTIMRTPPKETEKGDPRTETTKSQKRQRSDSSPGCIERQKIRKEYEINLGLDWVPTKSESIDDILDRALQALSIIQNGAESAEITTNISKAIRDATFIVSSMVTKLAYRIGTVEKNNIQLTSLLKQSTKNTTINESLPPPDLQVSKPTMTQFTDQKTYSTILQAKSSAPNVIKWNTPPQLKKHQTVIKIKNQTDPKIVLKEIKQSLIANGNGAQVFPNVRKLQSGAILVECESDVQQTELKEVLGKDKTFLIKDLQNTDPIIMITGIEKGYEPDEFISILLNENPELQALVGNDINKMIKYITKKDCRNNYKENWILQTKPTIFRWLIKNEKINFDLTRVYVQEYYNVAMCYKCCLFGHVAKYCKSALSCHKCGGTHEANLCPENTPLDCPNCKRLNLRNRIHSARDPKCPAFLQKIEKYKQSTDYGQSSESKTF